MDICRAQLPALQSAMTKLHNDLIGVAGVKSPQGFITNSNAVFKATAAQDVALANAVRAFPAFNIATAGTIDRVKRFAVDTKPLIDEVRPAAPALSQALEASVTLAPELRALMINIAPLTAASAAGVPALQQFLTDSVPWLKRLTPYLGNLVPVLDYINVYRREVAASSRTARRRRRRPTSTTPRPSNCTTSGSRTRSTRGGHRVSERARERATQSVHSARWLRPATQRPLGVRQLPLHEQSTTRHRGDDSR